MPPKRQLSVHEEPVMKAKSSKKTKTPEKKIVPQSGGPNLNKNITDMLTELGNNEKSTGNVFKANAYFKAARNLGAYDKVIESGKEASKIEGVGDKIAKKIDELLSTGIGPVAAKKFTEEGFKTVEDLKKIQNRLNHHQQIGLKYLDELEKRIPRAEMEVWDAPVQNIVTELDNDFMITICGSYRRGKESSGDVDFLLTHRKYESEKSKGKKKIPGHLNTVVEALKSQKIITDDLASGDAKYMGVSLLPEEQAEKIGQDPRMHRRIDIQLVPYDEYFAGLLYFTGSDAFNRYCRLKAQEKGYTLNEYGLFERNEDEKKGIKRTIHSEQELFEILGMDYLQPKERDW